ncbi:basic secretory protein-like protein [Mucilaginibacter sp.]|uniref:basic secretory protein-like protein n=1 Tax=Mucilaginibacter sp. TaxID=1882438 RepID=UPI003D0DF5D3
MKNTLAIITLLACFIITTANAQTTQVYNKNGYKLTFINYDATFDKAEQERLVTTFFTVYPKLAKEYNPATLKAVIMVIDTTYKGVAATADGKVTIAAHWLHQRPEDIDVVTHEVMHIVQDYGDSSGPGWLTEGIADYARNKFGVNNAAAKWTLPAYKATQNYDNAYRITARFLVWVEQTVKPGIVKELDSQMRKHTYTDNSWKQLTGKTVDELWKSYTENPAITVKDI